MLYFIIFLLLSVYFYRQLYALNKGIRLVRNKKKLHFLIIGIILVLFTISVYALILFSKSFNPIKLRLSYIFINTLLCIYLPLFFLIAFDIVFLIATLILRYLIRSHVLLQSIRLKLKLSLYVLLLFLLLYGIVIGKNIQKVENVKLSFENLPSNFEGLRIVQISDIHIGSLYGNRMKLRRLVETVNSLKPDILLFTGDIVNKTSNELDIYPDLFKKMNAAYGKYAVLGNHDYGDYAKWDSFYKKQAETVKLLNYYEANDVVVLKNQGVIIKNGKQEIQLVGTENWGLSPFPQYGNIDRALDRYGDSGFDILMAHDPNFWGSEILKKTKVELTLSGHTHGFQIGCIIGDKKYTLAKLKSKYDSGLIISDNQVLYINTGWGVIGYLGRIGIRPEITLIELYKK